MTRTFGPALTRIATIATLALVALGTGTTAAHAEIGLVGELNTTGAGALGAQPGEIAVDPNTSEVYVTDPENHRVMKYDAAGNFVLMVGGEVNRTKVNEAGTTAVEQDVCTASSGDECQPGTEGTAPGQFVYCAGIAVDPTSGDVYVASSVPLGSGEKDAVERFDTNGNYLSEIESEVGNTPNLKMSIEGALTVDLLGNLYVAGVGLSNDAVIFKFDSSGAYRSETEERPGGEAYSVFTGIAADEEGAVYVSTHTGGREEEVLKFGSAGLLLYVLPALSCREERLRRKPSLAVNLVTGDFFELIEQLNEVCLESGTEVVEYTSTGTEVQAFPALDNGRGIAFDARRGVLYEVQGDNRVAIYGPFPTPPAQAPAVVDEASSDPGLGSVSIEARINPHLSDTSYTFEYGTDPSLAGAVGVPLSPGDVGSGFLPVGVKADLTGLRQSTSYYYRVVAHNSFGGGSGSMVTGPTKAFTTLAPPPSVMGVGASGMTLGSAVLSGTVIPGSTGAASDTKWCFEYGTVAGGEYNLGSQPVVAGDAGQGSAGAAVSVHLTGLAPASTYRYRLVAVNSLGLEQGSTACGTEGGHETDSAEGLFTTAISLPEPQASTGGASGVAQNAATITGTVEPRGVRTSYEFQVGLDTSYGAEVFGEAGSGSEPRSVALSLQHLQPGTTYHYRLVAISAGGTSYGADAVFTTSVFPAAEPAAPGSPPLVATPAFAFPSGKAAAVGKAVAKKVKRKRRKAPAKKHRKAIKSGHRRVGKRRQG